MEFWQRWHLCFTVCFDIIFVDARETDDYSAGNCKKFYLDRFAGGV